MEEQKERFIIDDEGSADWALRTINKHKKQQKENSDLANNEIEKWNEWREEENNKVQNSIDHLQGLLAEYAMEKRKENPDFKSRKLPHGKIGFKKPQAKWEYDEEMLIGSLKKMGMSDFIKTKEQPDKANIKKNFDVYDGKVINTETGEMIEGISVTESDEKFEVKTNE